MGAVEATEGTSEVIEKLDLEEGTSTDSVKVGDEKDTTETIASTDEKVSADETSLQAQLDEVQEQNREQARTIANLEKTLVKVNDILVKAKLIEDESPEEKALAVQAEKTRNQQLETMLELMELSPAYQDVKQVVTRKRFDDIVEQLARVKVTKEGGRLVEAVGSIEDEIWGMTNPYKYMYGKIKEFHPDYHKREKGEDVPSDIHDMPGGQQPKGNGAWTAAKIDALGEEELDQVPADIYQKYLRNELK